MKCHPTFPDEFGSVSHNHPSAADRCSTRSPHLYAAHFVANHMRQRRLGDLARKIGALGRLITKRGAEAIGRKVGTVSPGEQS
jgi:hypothetical protein